MNNKNDLKSQENKEKVCSGGGYLEDKKHVGERAISILPKGLNMSSLIEDAQERDMFILSAIVGLSACMPNVLSVYRGRSITPHHFMYAVGPPESGKAMVNTAKTITYGVNKSIYSDYLEEKKIYDNQGEEDTVKKPSLNKLYISDDTTSAAFVRSLTYQDATGSLLVTPEAGTLMKSVGKDHGGFLDQLLKCWGHEIIDKDLVQNDEYNVCEFPKLAMALASTPGGFKKFVENTEGDGLLSRLLVYTTKSVDKPLDISVSFDYKYLTDDLGNDCLNMFNYFSINPCEFKLTEPQVKTFNFIVNRLKKALQLVNKDITSVKRFTMSLYRQLMTISVYRAFCEGGLGSIVNPTELDFEVMIDLAYLQGYHLLSVYDTIPSLKVSLVNIFSVLESMPPLFNSKDFLKELTKMGMQYRTAERRLATLKSLGHVFKAGKRGLYSKNPMNLKK